MWSLLHCWGLLLKLNHNLSCAQVWYCVSPKDRPKFEAMAKSNFPELYNVCPAFMRHKDILFSPKLLRSYGVEYVQVSSYVAFCIMTVSLHCIPGVIVQAEGQISSCCPSHTLLRSCNQMTM